MQCRTKRRIHFSVSSVAHDFPFSFQALATTRVQISPIEGGPNDAPSLHSQSDISRNRKFSGLGSDTDIMTASTRAYVSALNKLLTWNLRRKDQTNGATTEVNGGAGDAKAMPSPVVTAGAE